MFLFCLMFAMSLCASVYMCFVATCWERAGPLGSRLWSLCVCNFPIGILGRVWYLIVSTPDLCTLTYIEYSFIHVFPGPVDHTIGSLNINLNLRIVKLETVIIYWKSCSLLLWDLPVFMLVQQCNCQVLL